MKNQKHLGQAIRLRPRRNTPAMKLAARLYRLTHAEIERFDCIYRVGDRWRSFRQSLLAEARNWRVSWRPVLKTNQRCRWQYLAGICSSYNPPGPETPMREIPSAARYICWRVETEVRRFDAGERRTRG